MGGPHRGLNLNIVGWQPVIFLGNVGLKELPDSVSQFFKLLFLPWCQPVFRRFHRLIQPSDHERCDGP